MSGIARKPVLAIVGGSGDLGSGLGRRWAQAGYAVIIGSRAADKAEAAAAELRASLHARGFDNLDVRGADNISAARAGDIIALTVPFAHQAATLAEIRAALQGKILIDVTVPLVPPKVARVQLPAEGSAGQIAQKILGDDVRVVSAFQNVAAHLLQQTQSTQQNGAIDCDVLVCGDDKDAREQVIALAEAAGMRGLHAGSIANAAATEALTSLLIFINKHYSSEKSGGTHAGIRITGIGEY